MGKRSRGLAERRRLVNEVAASTARSETEPPTAAGIEVAPVLFCIENDVGRQEWIYALTEPAGDCAGELRRIHGTPWHICELHLLQAFLRGRRFFTTKAAA